MGTIITRGTIRGTIISAYHPPKISLVTPQRTITALGDDILGILSVPIPRTGKKKIDK
jgi:hypothetical protein